MKALVIAAVVAVVTVGCNQANGTDLAGTCAELRDVYATMVTPQHGEQLTDDLRQLTEAANRAGNDEVTELALTARSQWSKAWDLMNDKPNVHTYDEDEDVRAHYYASNQALNELRERCGEAGEQTPPEQWPTEQTT